jgi:hypothetical protein
MTHPIYTQTTLEALSTAQVKGIAKSIGAIPDGDKRVKQTWISAVIDHQKVFTPAKFKAIEAHIEMVENRWESVTPTSELPSELPTIETVMNRMKSVTPAASELTSESPTIDSYVPSPRTHADDVSFAAAMGLTYDDVFKLEPWNPNIDGDALPGDEIEQAAATQNPTPHGASIVAIIAVLFFGLILLIIKTGISSIATLFNVAIKLKSRVLSATKSLNSNLLGRDLLIK